MNDILINDMVFNGDKTLFEMDVMQKVDIWTDGACSGNPGPGGWGALLRYGDIQKEIFGGEADTTNNRMELMAPIKSLEMLTKSCHVTLYTDSIYVKNGMTQWIKGWIAKGWKTSSGADVKNIDLWQKLLSVSEKHQINWIWIKGHAGHKENEQVDNLARQGCLLYKQK